MSSVTKLCIVDEQDLRADEGFRFPWSTTLYRNSALLERFFSSRRLGAHARKNYRRALRSFNDLVRLPLEVAQTSDLEEWYRKADAQLAASTILLYAVHLGALLKYALRGRGFNKWEAMARAEEILEGVPTLDLRREVNKVELDRDKIFLWKEFEAVMKAARHPRVKAYLAVKLELGCRKGGLLSLRVRDVRLRGRYAEVLVKGKTGIRPLPLIYSVPYLRRWLEAHPKPDDLDAPLWATVWRGKVKQISHDAINKTLARLCRKAGVRHLSPHLFRHTAETAWARKGMNEAMIRKRAGYSPKSRMPARYIHLAGCDVFSAVLEMEGVEEGS